MKNMHQLAQEYWHGFCVFVTLYCNKENSNAQETRANIDLLPKYKEANNIYEHLYYTELFEGEEFSKKSLT